MSIKIKNLRISPYSQKDDLKVIFGDQMTVTFEIEHVAGESYACALDNERILYPPNRPVCAYTEAFTRDGDNVTYKGAQCARDLNENVNLKDGLIKILNQRLKQTETQCP